MVLTACGGLPVTRAPVSVPSRGETLTGYAPVIFGMPRHAVMRHLHQHGLPLQAVRHDAIRFHDRWLGHHVEVTQHFSDDDRAMNADMRVVGSQASSAAHCQQQFDDTWRALSQRYGYADFSPKTGRFQHGQGGYTRFTFTDSSYIQLDYHYRDNAPKQERCVLTASYQPAWVTLCLIISNRFCNSDPSTIVQPYQRLPE